MPGLLGASLMGSSAQMPARDRVMAGTSLDDGGRDPEDRTSTRHASGSAWVAMADGLDKDHGC